MLPTYNEAENLPRLVSALLSLPLDLSVLVVDDQSPDGTGQIADRLGRTAAQVLLRWCVERDLVVIPKSTHRERIEENSRIFDFTIPDEDMAALDALDDTGGTDRALERRWW